MEQNTRESPSLKRKPPTELQHSAVGTKVARGKALLSKETSPDLPIETWKECWKRTLGLEVTWPKKVARVLAYKQVCKRWLAQLKQLWHEVCHRHPPTIEGWVITMVWENRLLQLEENSPKRK